MGFVFWEVSDLARASTRCIHVQVMELNKQVVNRAEEPCAREGFKHGELFALNVEPALQPRESP